MKTQKIKTVVQYLALLLAMVFIQSCETEIPPEDPTPPKFSFEISGDGFHHTFNQDSDFENITLNLKSGSTYNFIFSATDKGGLESAYWYIKHYNKTRIETPIPNPWRIVYQHYDDRTIRWEGDETNPLTGAIISGDFKVNGENSSTRFSFGAADFGGEGRMPNYTRKLLNVSISDRPTGITS